MLATLDTWRVYLPVGSKWQCRLLRDYLPNAQQQVMQWWGYCWLGWGWHSRAEVMKATPGVQNTNRVQIQPFPVYEKDLRIRLK